MSAPRVPLVVRVPPKINRNGPVPPRHPELGPCWLWTAATDDNGYGRVKINGRTPKAHRVVYELLVGPIPEGLEPDHLCEVKGCVKAVADENGPAHLELTTHPENCRRHYDNETCKNGHRWTSENTWRSPKHGGRGCRACNREKHRKTARLRREAVLV